MKRYTFTKAIVCMLACLFVMSTSLFAQTLMSDKTDYFPGSLATLTGTGFGSGETVTMQVVHADTSFDNSDPTHQPWDITADGNGNFVATWQVNLDQDQVGQMLLATADGQSSGAHAEVLFMDNEAADLDQVRNGSATSPNDPGDWVNGNSGSSNSHYVEGYSIPYRMVLTGLTVGTHTLDIEWDISHSSVNAIDFITQFDRLEPHITQFGHAAETIDPLIGTGLVGPSIVTLAIPTPLVNSTTETVDGISQPSTRFLSLPAGERVMTMYNGTTIDSLIYIANSDGVVGGDLSASQSACRMRIYFTSSYSTVVFAWGGHIAASADWGSGNSAGGISGSPYHTRLKDLDGGGGNQDRSLSADAVEPPVCNITDTTACPNNVVTYAGPTGAGFTYSWQIINNNTGASIVSASTNQSVDVNVGNTQGTFDIEITVSSGLASSTCHKTITLDTCCVQEVPPCSVTGDDQVECGSSHDYTATRPEINCDDATISWSITGDGHFTGATDGLTVTVVAGPNCSGSYTVTANFTCNQPEGCSALSSTCSKTASVIDITPPNITCPSVTSLIDCPAQPNFGNATATDACDNDVAITFNDVTTAACGNTYSTTRTWTATDDCGNTASCSRTIVVRDITPPSIACPSVTSPIDCPAQPNFGDATATDACDGNVTITHADVTTPACGNTYSTTRTWTATDDCGNTATCSRTIVVRDITPPNINCPSVTSPIECPAQPNFGDATATDACDGNVTITHTDATTAACGNTYSTTRTWTATDDCGNTATCSRTIVVRDITPPSINCPSVTSPIDCPAQPNFGDATATDACDGNVTITHTDATTAACGNTYSTTRTWTATDDCGNTATCSRTIVVRDITPPSITCPSVVSPIDCPAQPNFGDATATDACDGNVTITHSDATTPGCTGGITRTWTATDDCGNTATCSRTIIIHDVTPPIITCPSVTSPIECPAQPNFGDATATDACDNSVTITHADVTTAACGNTYSTTRTWTATDDCGNTATCSRTIVVRDITPPSINCPSVTSPIDCPAQPNFGDATATDACDGNVTITHTDATTAACGNTYSTTRTWTATDDCGNTATCSRTIVVRDITPPSINCPSVTSPIECPSQPNFGDATATDACDGNVTITHSDATTAACGNTYSTTRTWTATDDCGNTATCSRTIVVRDITPPSINCPSVTSPIECPAQPNFGDATATDACDGNVTITHTDATTAACGNTYSTTRTWTATDDCGNTATCSRTIVVRDITPPVLSGCPVPTKKYQCYASVPAPPNVTATDACDGPVTVNFSESQTHQGSSCHNIITRTWTASDACGNSVSCTQTITVNDNKVPVLSGCPAPDGGTYQCLADVPAPPTVTATDNCDPQVPVIYNEVQSHPGLNCNNTITRTWTATDDCGKHSSCGQTIIVNDNTVPVITCPADLMICSSQTINLGTATATDNCGGTVTISNNAPSTYSIGATTVIWTAVDGCGNSATCQQTVTVIDCSEGCTYTQGFYGNGGKNCSGTKAINVINSALSQGPLVTGTPGHSITFGTSEGSCLNSKLPSGTTPSQLPSGDVSCAGATGSSYLNNGKFKDVLLGQVIALGISLRKSSALGTFAITGKYLTTYKASACTNGVIVPGTKQVYGPIPSAVLTALNNSGDITVANLWTLANNALGNGSTTPSLSAWNNAVDIINNGFDGCRILIGFGNSSSGLKLGDDETSVDNSISVLNMYPNPTSGLLTIAFTAPAGKTSIDIYNISGILVYHAESTQETAGIAIQHNLDASTWADGVYFVRLSSSDNSVVGKVIVTK
ncbi:MAG TPA: HYR domain-containing protein [Chitinophagales bacterium]|nr:HYR domain-containing protein [Chitinophagales bacterium]